MIDDWTFQYFQPPEKYNGLENEERNLFAYV